MGSKGGDTLAQHVERKKPKVTPEEEEEVEERLQTLTFQSERVGAEGSQNTALVVQYCCVLAEFESGVGGGTGH